MILKKVNRGIPHIEDLPPVEFLMLVDEIDTSYEATEKLDGAQMLFGLDELGFYTSRESKGGSRVYNEGDYGITFSSTYLRSVHKLLEQALPILKVSGLSVGDQVEAEVLYGVIPNVVPYSLTKNYIVFLRTTQGSVNIDKLNHGLSSYSTTIRLCAPVSLDGIETEINERIDTWHFSRAPIYNLPSINAVYPLLNKFREYLSEKSGISVYSNYNIECMPLNRRPTNIDPEVWKDLKEEVSTLRDKIRLVCMEHKLAIKESLLTILVRSHSSAFGPALKDGGWIEGIVLKHTSTGEMTKLVDKDVFGVTRIEAWRVRNSLTEKARNIHGDLSFLGRLNKDLAVSIGHPSLATTQAKAYLLKTDLKTLTEEMNLACIKEYWSLTLLEAQHDLLVELSDYEKEKIHPGYSTGLYDATRQRTLQTFATTFKTLQTMQLLTVQSKEPSDLIEILIRNKSISK